MGDFWHQAVFVDHVLIWDMATGTPTPLTAVATAGVTPVKGLLEKDTICSLQHCRKL